MLFGLSFLAIALCVFLFYFFASFIPTVYLFHWVILLGALVLLINPMSKQLFTLFTTGSEKTPRSSLWPWLSEILLLELSLIFTACGMMLVFTYWLPFNEQTPSQGMENALLIFFKEYGLFPWAIYALYAVSLAKTSYIDNKDAYFSRVFSPLFKTQPETTLGKIIDFQARAATTTAVASICAFGILLIVCLCTPKSIALESGFHGKTIIIAIALLLLGSTKKLKHLLKPILKPHRSPLWIFIPILLLLALFIGLLNALFSTLGHTPVKIPILIEWLNHQGFTTLFLIFMISWWICWTPLFAIHLARLSKNRSIRSMIFATLLLPTVLTAILLFFPKSSAVFTYFPKITSLFSLLGTYYLLSKILQRPSLPLLIHSYLPKYNGYKYRNPYFYLQKMFQLILIILYLYLPSGLTLPSFFIFCIAFGFTLQIPFILFISLGFNKS